MARNRGRIELTARGIVLGVLITVVFTAANVYLGLKVGLTFASSIPAAVISMAILRALFRNATIWENNIVQTVASAAGTLSSIIFVLPGLVMIGWWTGFPFWTSFGVCVVGGILGVMYTIPLRRALVTQSTLPYPEGVAAAEVLKVGSGHAPGSGAVGAGEAAAGLKAVVLGAVASVAVALAVAMKFAAAEVARYFRPTATTATGLGGQTSLALLGAGHLMGLSVGVAMAVGLLIAWGVAVPVFSHLDVVSGARAAGLDAEAAAQAAWAPRVRFIGAGAIAVAAIWTLGRLAAPVTRGLASAMAAQAKRSAGKAEDLPLSERDLPIGLVGLTALAMLAPLAFMAWRFLATGPLAGQLVAPLVIVGVVYVVVAGFLVAAVCGYMAGLIGSSNSPVSGLAILSVLGAASLAVLIAGAGADPAARQALIAFSLFITSIVLCVATIANDNLQDLKTGQLVEATPWRQQIALVVGVIAGAVVIPPVLDVLNRAFGFAGAPNLNAIASQPLPAPQATLISTLAKGVVGGDLDWTLLGVGVLVGAGLIAIDEALRALTQKQSLPPLGVGIAIYLPAAVTVPVILGAVIGWVYDRTAGAPGASWSGAARRLGVLIASGLIVGESLFNVVLAGVIAASGQEAPLAFFGDVLGANALIVGFVGAALAALGLYLWAARAARRLSASAQ